MRPPPGTRPKRRGSSEGVLDSLGVLAADSWGAVADFARGWRVARGVGSGAGADRKGSSGVLAAAADFLVALLVATFFTGVDSIETEGVAAFFVTVLAAVFLAATFFTAVLLAVVFEAAVLPIAVLVARLRAGEVSSLLPVFDLGEESSLVLVLIRNLLRWVGACRVGGVADVLRVGYQVRFCART